MRSARHHGSKYSEQKLRELAAAILEAVLRGEIGPTSVTELARRFEVSPALVRAVLQQPDEMRRLNLLGESVVAIQAQELGRELTLPGACASIVLVRTQPTCPIEGMHAS
jgi:transposase-like protein